ncbi:MAG TPA: hypothetical protein RMH99_08610 [Sandaracinaceae bacterium LLY-WYZ-13_1]|nr:hypothetical protein [Sandaracinaceae bacterium LLY-WYZ-13_1]
MTRRLLFASLLLLAGCDCSAADEPGASAPTAEPAQEPAAPAPTNPCRSLADVREALSLDSARLQRTEHELSGEPPAELVVWHTEDDEGADTDDVPTGAKRARLWVIDCSGDAPRALGSEELSFVDDPSARRNTPNPAGLRMRPVSAGDRTFLRVDVTSLGARVFSEDVVFLEVADGALRRVFGCETAYDSRDTEGELTASVRREVTLDGEADAPHVRVRRQRRGEGPIDEASYAWAEGGFDPGDDADLCAD